MPVKSVTPTVAVAVFDGSATLVAVMVTTPAAEGAVNVTALPEVLLVGENPPPVVAPVEVNDQATPAFVATLVSVAVTKSVCDATIPPRLGETLTATAATTVTLADPERVGSAAEVAVTVTAELGAEAGAVYSPELLTVPTAELPPATPFTLH